MVQATVWPVVSEPAMKKTANSSSSRALDRGCPLESLSRSRCPALRKAHYASRMLSVLFSRGCLKTALLQCSVDWSRSRHTKIDNRWLAGPDDCTLTDSVHASAERQRLERTV